MASDIPELFEKYYSPRTPWSQKGDRGRLLVVSGSAEYSGSPVFNSISALRTGCDLVTVIGHPRAMNALASFSPDVITVPLRGELKESDVSLVVDHSTRAHAVLIGSGLSRGESTHRAIRQIVREVSLPVVLDAEAIRAIAGDPSVLRGREVLMTPNRSEFAHLSGETAGDSAGERAQHALRVARELGVTVLLKGHIDIVTDGARMSENNTGVPQMAKGGFGDTLAGVAGALLARGASLFDAGVLSAFINGRAGERAVQAHGEGVLASDMFANLPHVIRREHNSHI